MTLPSLRKRRTILFSTPRANISVRGGRWSGWTLAVVILLNSGLVQAQSKDAGTVIPPAVNSDSPQTQIVPVEPHIPSASLPPGTAFLRTNRRYGRLRTNRGRTYTRPVVEKQRAEVIAIDGVAVDPHAGGVEVMDKSTRPPSRLARMFGFRQKVPTRTQEFTKRIPGRSASRGYRPQPGEKDSLARRTVRLASLPQADEMEDDNETSDNPTDDTQQEANVDVGGPLDKDPFRQGGLREIAPTLDYAFADIDKDDLPEEVNFEEGFYQPRRMQPMVVNWRASNLHHYPLYFEDPQLERYGHTYHPLLQPFASTARFAVQLAGLPYQMSMDPVWKRRYTLGWYRPGECAPYLHHRFPFNNKASLIQAATVAGLFFVIP